MSDLTQRALQRLRELRAEIVELESFLQTAAKLNPDNHESEASTKIVYRRPPLQESSNLAERALREAGPLHLRRIIDAMIRLGWRSSGDPRLDYKNLHTILSAQPKRFRKLGRGIFTVTASRGAKNPEKIGNQRSLPQAQGGGSAQGVLRSRKSTVWTESV